MAGIFSAYPSASTNEASLTGPILRFWGPANVKNFTVLVWENPKKKILPETYRIHLMNQLFG